MDTLALILLIIGGINWGALGLLRLQKRFPASTVGIWGALISFTILNLVPIEALCR